MIIASLPLPNAVAPYYLVDYFVQLITSGGYLSLYALMTLESTLIPIPSEIVMPFAGYLVFLKQWNFFMVGLTGTLANLTGSIIAYFIGLYGGRRLVLKYGRFVLLGERHLAVTENFFSRYGDKTIFIGRCLPAIRTYISLPAGFGKMNLRKFVIYTLLGSLLWNFALTYGGLALGENWEKILYLARYADIAVVVGIIAIAVWLVTRRKSSNC
jgi:membrane protein DedA with SNARE-associated domain